MMQDILYTSIKLPKKLKTFMLKSISNTYPMGKDNLLVFLLKSFIFLNPLKGITLGFIYTII